MNTLATLQQSFAHQVRTGDPAHATHGDISGHMEIYINAYRGRMIQALMANFPVLHRALGDAAFGELASAYCQAQPSQHRSIRWLGDGLVDFIRENPDCIPHPALLDIARMDWGMCAAFDAQDVPCLSLADLGAVPPTDWPTMTFHTVPAFQMLDLQWSVEALWHALNADAEAQTSAPEPAPHTMLIWRQQLECRWRTVRPDELTALRLLTRQASFADICEALLQEGVSEPAQTAAHLLTTWLTEGLLAAGAADELA